MPVQTITITTCGRCGREQQKPWKPRQVAVTVGVGDGAPADFYRIEDGCADCFGAFERLVKEFGARFPGGRRAPKKKEPQAALPGFGDAPKTEAPKVEEATP